MRLLEETLQRISKERRQRPGTAALMTHVVLGYPSLKQSMDIVRAMADAGASLIELQIPFSDPMADGPTIMRANEAALAQGVTPKACLEAMEKLSTRVSVPLLFMSYFNLLYNYGQTKTDGGFRSFCRDAGRAGAQGLIVPDVPPEENRERYWTLPLEYGITPIPLVAPVSSVERMKKIRAVTQCGAFLYCVSSTATTGAQSQLPPDLKRYLARIRQNFSVPLAVGFGISTPEHVRAVGCLADIAVVGSAVINIIRDTPKQRQIAKVRSFVERLSGHNPSR